MSASIEELCEEVIEARAKRGDLKTELDVVDGRLKELEERLANQMIEGDAKAARVGGFEFSATTKINWKPVAAQRDALVAALKDGAPELVKESVNASTLAAYLRKHETQLEKESPSWWDAAKSCVQRTESAALSVRKKGKAK